MLQKPAPEIGAVNSMLYSGVCVIPSDIVLLLAPGFWSRTEHDYSMPELSRMGCCDWLAYNESA